MKYYKKLIGEKVYLSPVSADDADTFTRWMNDFNVTDYTGRSAALVTLPSEQSWINSEIEGKSYIFSIVKNEDDKIIGNLDLQNINHIDRTATLGILIGDAGERNKGYGTEAIGLALDFAFNYLNINSINLGVFEFNERAKKCYEKIGFKEYGRRRKNKFVSGKYYDTIYMDILAEEFKQSFIKNKNV